MNISLLEKLLSQTVYLLFIVSKWKKFISPRNHLIHFILTLAKVHKVACEIINDNFHGLVELISLKLFISKKPCNNCNPVDTEAVFLWEGEKRRPQIRLRLAG